MPFFFKSVIFDCEKNSEVPYQNIKERIKRLVLKVEAFFFDVKRRKTKDEDGPTKLAD